MQFVVSLHYLLVLRVSSLRGHRKGNGRGVPSSNVRDALAREGLLSTERGRELFLETCLIGFGVHRRRARRRTTWQVFPVAPPPSSSTLDRCSTAAGMARRISTSANNKSRHRSISYYVRTRSVWPRGGSNSAGRIARKSPCREGKESMSHSCATEGMYM